MNQQKNHASTVRSQAHGVILERSRGSRRAKRVTAPPRRSASVRRSRAAAQHPHPRFAWYAGLAVMAVIEVIEWPLAIVMMLGHEIAHRAHSKALRDFAEGVEAGL